MEITSLNMAKKQNEIFKRQNEPEMQQLLVTQHFAYTNAKRWVAVLFCVLVILPVGIDIALFFSLPNIAVGILSFLSFILLALGELIREHISNQKKLAAMLQQKFDIYVFDMDTNCGIDENLIAHQIEKYKNKDWQRKENWYQNYESLDKYKVIFYCQKENIDWTGNISKKFCNFLIIVIAFLFISFIVNLIINNSSIIKILSIAITALPLLSYGFSSYKKIKRDNNELLEMDKFAKEINRRIEEINEDDLSNRVNILQTMIYKFRQSKYLIPDWFESKYHKHLQAVEARKAGQRISKSRKRKK